MRNRTIILNREDVNNPLHPNLFNYFLTTLGVDPQADEVCLELSSIDDNKKIEDKGVNHVNSDNSRA